MLLVKHFYHQNFLVRESGWHPWSRFPTESCKENWLWTNGTTHGPMWRDKVLDRRKREHGVQSPGSRNNYPSFEFRHFSTNQHTWSRAPYQIRTGWALYREYNHLCCAWNTWSAKWQILNQCSEHQIQFYYTPCQSTTGDLCILWWSACRWVYPSNVPDQWWL